MSDLITLNIPSIPMDAADEIANTFGLGGNMQSQINTFVRNNPQAVEEAAKLGIGIEQYYMNQVLGYDVGQSGVNQSGDSNQNFVQNLIQNTKKTVGKLAGGTVDTVGDVVDLGVRTVTGGSELQDIFNSDEYTNMLRNSPVYKTAEEVVGNVVDSTVSTLENVGGKVADAVADADDAPVMDSGAAGGFLRDDITGEGTFLGGANTLMEDDERINYDTSTSGSEQGSSGMDSRFEEYYNILREQGPQAAEIYAQNLGLFVEGVGSALFGAARQYTDENLRSLGRSVGIRDGSVPTLQEIAEKGARLDPTEGKRITDVLMGSQAASGREFDPSIAQVGIDMNQLMYNRREPFIRAGINASNIAPGIEFGGGLAATMEGALPTFSDIFKMNQADVQNEFNQQLLASQESVSDINKILGTVNALSGLYDSNFLGVQDLITNTLEGMGIGGQNQNVMTDQNQQNQFVMQDDILEDLYKKYITGGG